MLKIEELEVHIGEHRILKEVSLEVNEGERVAILGANGAGKTTLIKSIVGLIKPHAGHISFRDNKLNQMPPQAISRLGIACVPEGRRPFKEMSVLDNLRMGAYNPGARSKLKQSLEEVTELFPVLKERLRQPAGTLSGGEQQMLAIGRALMSRPVLLLVDELSLGLAPIVTKEIYQVLGRVGEKMTLIMVEQNVNQVLRHTERAYLMETGKVVRSGKSSQFLDDPAIRDTYLGY